MTCTIAVQKKLLDEACRIGEHKSEKEAVLAALKEYIQRRKQMNIIELFGHVDYDPNYDYKSQRSGGQKVTLS
ncbi:MAG: type II toxin-antitoxin system VapB family antitoxin [Candidatus Wallbacteria bacterium]|nr:type II toxin-antitoxin system VapB family antitoxin [Candidatus Wallbacteria bacterium]